MQERHCHYLLKDYISLPDGNGREICSLETGRSEFVAVDTTLLIELDQQPGSLVGGATRPDL